MKVILSISGGGVRGVIPARVLAAIEERLGGRIADHVDLVAGTSIGGLLALLLAKGALEACQMPRLFRVFGKDIFKRSPWHAVASMGGLAEELYQRDGLDSVLLHLLGNARLENALVPVMVTSYDTEGRQVVVMKSWRREHASIFMSAAARATSAAPCYFEPVREIIDTELGQAVPLIDGGVYANSPAACAYAEAVRMWPGEEIFLLSLGTGRQVRPITYWEACGWGLARWAVPLLSILFDAQEQAVDYQLRTLLGNNYLRFDIDLENASDDLDNVSRANLAALEHEASRLVTLYQPEIERVAEILQNKTCTAVSDSTIGR